MKPVALITGGQKGIGLGIARVLSKAGYALALSASSSDETDTVQATLDELMADARYYQHDMRETDGVPGLLDKIEKDMGPVTALVSNAGVPAQVRGDMLDLVADAFDFVMDVNLKGAFFLAQEAARRMLLLPEYPYRSIVFVTSVSAELVSVERAEYCISKAGASMMAKLFTARLAANNIGVFEVRPGIIETGMTACVKDTYTARIESGLVPAARWGVPSDIGEAVLPLVQGRMAFATGTVVPVDGGLSIHRL